MFLDYARHRAEYGNVAVIPTTAFFHGLDTRSEIGVDIEPGKRLIIRYFAQSEPDPQGRRAVFFELNGQPRRIKVQDRSLAPQAAAPRKAEEGNPDHVAAPMAGLIVNVAVREGQKVARGDHLFSMEAMKMETAIHAPRDGTLAEIVTPVGSQVDGKDLVVVLAPEG